MTIPEKRFSLSNHLVFFLGFILLLIAGLIFLSQRFQGEEIFYFSGMRNYWSDQFFIWITHLGDLYPYVVFSVLFIFRRLLLALVAPALGISVYLTSIATKSYFQMPRPIPYFTGTGQIEDIILVEGAQMATGFSFPSGHTMSAFALFTFLTLLFAEKKRYQFLFLSIAVLVAISRIYLVQHFLVDTMAGALIGLLLGILFAFLYLRFVRPREISLLSRMNKS